MSSFPRAFAAFALLISAIAAPAAAQEADASATRHDQSAYPQSLQFGQDNWFYEGSDLEQERAWVFGELPNGLRYAVRYNGVPDGQVAFRAVVDAGSLYEEESEQGYAHLLEHLLFRESKYLGKNEAFSTWQAMGAQIGIDANATTSPTQTVYQIDVPDASQEDVRATLRYLSGMIEAPVLSDENVRDEFPIVLAEKRDGDSAQRRVADAQRETFYAGMRLGERAPIGTLETLQGATGDSVAAFHKRWYRPDKTVLVVAGAVDPIEVARLIEENYSGWEAPANPAPDPDFGDPVAPDDAAPSPGILPPLGQVTTMVEPDLSPALGWTILRPWRPVLDTKVYNRGLMRTTIAQSVLNRRLEARARAGSYLYAEVRQDDTYRSSDQTTISIAPLEGEWEKALAEVRGIIADAIANPPTQEEIDREASELGVAYQDYFARRGLRNSSEVADDIVGALDIRETTTSPGAVLRLYQSALPGFTPEAIHDATRELFKGKVGRALLLSDRPGVGDPVALTRALTREVAPDTGARLAAAEVDFDELPAIGTPREAQITATGAQQIERLDWGNGVSALIWPKDNEPGRLTVKVRFGAGQRAFSADEVPYARMGELALVASGNAGLDNEALDRLTNGRKIGFDFTIEDGRFVFSAETRNEDLADQLYLFASKFVYPEWDAGPVKRARAAGIQGYRSYATSAPGVLERDLELLLHDNDPRFRAATAEDFENTTDEEFARVWGEILKHGPVEVQVFGDFNRAAGIAALNRSFGALPPRDPLPADTAPTTVPATAPTSTPIKVTHRGPSDQAMAVVAWPTSGGVVEYRKARQLEVVSTLFSNRLLEALRQRLGASYAPQMISQWPVSIDNGGRLMALALVKPEDVPAIFEEVDAIAADLVANGPGEDELAKATSPLRRMLRPETLGAAFYMWQLDDATFDPRRIGQLDSAIADFTLVTAEDVQALAREYLRPEEAIHIEIMPEG
ncbi:M16 family metallopeptidase [Pseudoblastomonas halimionae]|uniref:Insulinase family protein n=1 Tax=Alteriqipengyuania halimionae TaxID=1926630 RepID=A0A6I4U1Q7_9SPHN|nr:M16 family metallopeptidase [Alteriqipengyuania halimionae]MXP10019.1 insulinase family protein [Alteriqipengyuania halimionae]